MIRKFRKIFRPTINPSSPTRSPDSTSDESSYIKQTSTSITKQLFTGRQKESFDSFFFLEIFFFSYLILIKYQGRVVFLFFFSNGFCCLFYRMKMLRTMVCEELDKEKRKKKLFWFSIEILVVCLFVEYKDKIKS